MKIIQRALDQPERCWVGGGDLAPLSCTTYDTARALECPSKGIPGPGLCFEIAAN